MRIGDNLKKLRLKTNFSQRDLADMLGVDKNTYCNWENNTTDVKCEFIPDLAKAFKVQIHQLFEMNNAINSNKVNSKVNLSGFSVTLLLPDKESFDKFIEAMRSISI